MTTGTVHASVGGVYRVVLDDARTVEASLRGRLKKSARPAERVVIGDRVHVSGTGDAWTIEGVLERTSMLARRARGGHQPKLLAANLDRLFAVVSLAAPPASAELVDRMLVLGEASGMRPTLVLNKLDLDVAGEAAARFTRLYRGIGYDVVATSAASGVGLEELRALACAGTSAFIGPSGVGKSSLLNALDPTLALPTGALSRKTGTGRHTTVGSRLLTLACGGSVADTPGFGDVGLWAVEPDQVAACFPELDGPAGRCRFRGCTHLHEPECGVREALERGEVLSSRYDSYVKLREEAGEAGA